MWATLIFGTLVVLVLAVLVGGMAWLGSERRERTVRRLAASGVVAGALLMLGGIWLVYSIGRWSAGLTCPDDGHGAGQLRVNGPPEPPWCEYPGTGLRSPVRMSTGFFFDRWWMVALTAATVLTLSVAAWMVRGALGYARFSTKRSS